MKYKKSKNPEVIELTKTCRDRIYPISNISFIPNEHGTKSCIWCGDPLKTRHPAARYCKDDACKYSAYAWANPQGDDGKRLLLIRQDWKCNICGFDWSNNKEAIWVGKGAKKRSLIPEDKRPEVDHIIPISKGGQAIGLENTQCICFSCHKQKSKIDNSGLRQRDPVSVRKRYLKKQYEKISDRQRDYMMKTPYTHREWDKLKEYSDSFFIDILTIEELNEYIEYYESKRYISYTDKLKDLRKIKVDKYNIVLNTGSDTKDG